MKQTGSFWYPPRRKAVALTRHAAIFLGLALLSTCGGAARAQSLTPSAGNLLLYNIGQTNPQTAPIITTYNTFMPADWDTSNRTNAFQKIFGVSDFAQSWIEQPGVLRSPNPVTGALTAAYLQPKCGNSGLDRRNGAALEVSTFMKPYDIYQGSIFLPYLRRTRGLTDFLPAAARARSAIDGNPPYEGDLACPTILPGQAATPTPAFLRTTYGQAAIFATNGITLIIDNAFNPFRWDGNVGDNRIMHREQSTLGLGFPVSPDGISEIKTIFQGLRSGSEIAPKQPHLMLSYDLDMTVQPAPGIAEPEIMTDMMDRPCSPQVARQPHDLFEASICTVAVGNGASEAWLLVKDFLKYRLLAPSIQLSLGVVLNSGNKFPWRDQEFMLAYYDYEDSHPPGFAATGNALINANSPIGNSNGRNAAWYRTRISTFHNASLFDDGWPIVSADADDWVMTSPDGSRHLTGTIDLTNYIHDFSERDLLPGMSGEWAGCSAQLPLDVPAPKTGKGCGGAQNLAGHAQPGAEPLSVYRVFIVPEVHGPFYVRIVVHAMRLYLTDKDL